ncbi:MAG TPA: CHAT domain-containing protein, partial [Bacteroidia bacterium]|nr:CHAT domain-containing protein [Bacteroidia bacterium]
GIIYEALGKCHQAAKQPSEALAAYQKALIAFTPGFQDTLPGFNPGKALWNREPWLFVIFIDKANAFEELGLVDQSLRCSENAFDYVNHLREQYNTAESRQFISGVLYPNYERAIALAVQHARQTRAAADNERIFAFMERSKVNEILLSLQKAEQFNAFQLPDSLLFKWRSLQAQISDRNSKPSEDGADPMPQLEKQEAELRRMIDTLAPGFSALTQTFAPVNVMEVQRNLDADEVFLEYFIGDRQIYIFAIDQQHAQCFANPKTPAFQAAVDQLINMVKEQPRGSLKRLYAAFEKTSHYLFRQLIGPVIQGNFRQRIPKSLIIVPDGRLALIPFECLVTQKLDSPTEQSFQTAAYLMRDCEIRYGHSATTLAKQNRPAGHRQTPFLGSILALSASPIAPGLQPLSQVKNEARAAADVLDGKAIDKASNADFMENCGDYNFLHFACHAFADTSNPLRSWIALQKDDDSIDSLFAYEVMGQQLSAELAVLSACETGAGKLQSGEGAMSLARAFFVAGCPRVMMSLWKINDEITAKIMDNFYNTMKFGKPAAQSLREARLEFLRSDDYANELIKYHPHYWAAMVMVGDEGPYLTQGPKSWTPWFVWGSVFALVIALWQRRRRRHRRKAA